VFECKYPIIAAPMNQVSELNLAVAMHKAGGFPSISGYCYETADQLIKALEEFVNVTNSSNIILAIDEYHLLNKNIISAIKQLKISHILKYFNENPNISSKTKILWQLPINNLLENLDSQIITMLSNFNIIQDLDRIYFLKGNDGAGRPGADTTKNLFDYHIQQTPTAKLVPMGGIGTANQVKYYIDNGAIAVSIGTLLAASKESCLTDAVKQAMITAKKEDIVPFNSDLQQNALIFKKININDDTRNNTKSLSIGINSAADIGHIFSGHAIRDIREINTVEEIVLRLSSQR
jgi:hypothetical protein